MKVFKKEEEPQIVIKQEFVDVDHPQVYNLRRNLKKSSGDRFDATAAKSDVSDNAKATFNHPENGLHQEFPHGNAHGGMKAYECKHCEFSTIYSGNLKQHVNNVHLGIKEFKCKLCKYETAYVSNLRNHVKSMHKGRKMVKKAPQKPHQNVKGNIFNIKQETNAQDTDFNLMKLACDQCDYVAHSKEKIREHRNRHLGIKDLKCNNCAFSTTYRHSLKRHVKEVHAKYLKQLNKYEIKGNHPGRNLDGDKTNRCDECSYTTAYKGNLNQHILSVHRKLDLHSCPYSPECQYRNSRPEIILRHIALVHVRGTSAQANGKISVRKNSFNQSENPKGNHGIKQEEGEGYSEVKENKCDQCSFTALRKSNLTQHISHVHGLKHYRCTLCNFATSYSKSLNNHLLVVHEKNDAIQKEGPNLKLGQSMDKKVNNSESKKRTDCMLCGFSAENQGELNAHLMINHVERDTNIDSGNATDLKLEKNRPMVLLKRLSSEQVEKMTSSNACNGSDQRLFNCDQCGFSTANEVNLRNHMNAHGSIKTNKCEYCDFATSYKSNLSHHRRVHQKDNLYSCPYNPDCEFKNARFSRMERHMSQKHINEGISVKNSSTSVHEGFTAKPGSSERYKCNECKFSSSISRSIIEHKNMHLGIKDNKCEHCDFVTSYKKNLHRHMKQKSCASQKFTNMKKRPDPEERQNTDGVENEVKKCPDCPLCGFSAENRGDLNAHLITNHVDM